MVISTKRQHYQIDKNMMSQFKPATEVLIWCHSFKLLPWWKPVAMVSTPRHNIIQQQLQATVQLNAMVQTASQYSRSSRSHGINLQSRYQLTTVIKLMALLLLYTISSHGCLGMILVPTCQVKYYAIWYQLHNLVSATYHGVYFIS